MKQKSAKFSQEKYLNMSRSKNNKIALPPVVPPLYTASPNDRELQKFTKKWADELYQVDTVIVELEVSVSVCDCLSVNLTFNLTQTAMS